MVNDVAGVAKPRIRIFSATWGIFWVSFFLYLLFSHHLPITDPVESNYALTAKEMVTTANWLSPQIYGHAWYDKPVFFYWLTALSFTLFGFCDLAARLVPALFAAAGLVLIYCFTAKITDSSTAFIATMIMGTSLEYVVLAKLIITDMVFSLFNSMALACFYLGYTGRHQAKRWYLGMYVSLALAVLTKGPVGLLLPCFVVIVFIGVQHHWSELKNMSIPVGVLLFAVITLPWYGAMYVVHGSDFLNTFFGVHNYLRATVSEHPRDNVYYYYVVVFLVSMLPWSAITIKAMLKGVKALPSKDFSVNRFCIIWNLAYFTFYSLMATKYVTYIFPMLFPASIVSALYLKQVFAEEQTKVVIYWTGIPLGVLTAAYVALAVWYLRPELVLTLTCLLLVVLFIWRQVRGKNAKQIFELFCFCQVVFLIILSIFVFPKIADSRSGKDIAKEIPDIHGSRIGLYRFYSTSSVYYSNNIAVKLEPGAAAKPEQSGMLSWDRKYTMPVQTLSEFMAEDRGQTWIVVPDEAVSRFVKEPKSANPKLIKAVGGYSYYSF
ncbi:putative membrane protein [Propionispora sp. 2/2-37]|uniref:ArnT family glycosyltransferase n=1 Tax=Propionispora sp. 2/2-37 TaxID=1677858 RepID=UPI0006BB68CC|nr:glycosyltransferase family 39 protein [Propionispora sp. 2/2-37]CUH93949.1 putative membrane protein [Propionispora sp. 2/2-37]